MSSWSHASALRMQRWVPALSLLFSFLFMLQFQLRKPPTFRDHVPSEIRKQCVYVCMYVCSHIHMCKCACIHTHTQTYIYYSPETAGYSPVFIPFSFVSKRSARLLIERLCRGTRLSVTADSKTKWKRILEDSLRVLGGEVFVLNFKISFHFAY